MMKIFDYASQREVCGIQMTTVAQGIVLLKHVILERGPAPLMMIVIRVNITHVVKQTVTVNILSQ